MVEDTRRLLRLLLLAAICALSFCQSEDDSSLYFSNAQSGRAVWLVEEANLPWIGSYEYLSSLVSENTVLLTVVDSSTGRTLGECTSQSHGNKWVKFQWALAADSMQCTVSPTNSSRVVFPAAPGPRTFSVRIQAGRGPACIKQMIVQNERPIGCPPHLARNSFSAMHFACNCPYEATSSEEPSESADPQFPIFELGTPSPTMETPAWTVSPCATHKCQHNGTCVVTQEGQATCLCQQGFTGSQCEVDVCAAVPCQNGGKCRATAGNEAVCECLAGFSGIICETAGGSCNPECTNGECVVTNGTSHCKCRQGFIGINCNVVDVCLGDAACAVFGEHAKCVLDPSNYIMHSTNLVNATYDCRCPHPVNGEFEDCLALHLAVQASAGTVGSSPSATPEMHPNPSGQTTGMFPNPTSEMVPNGQTSQFSMFPNTMTEQPGMLPNGETPTRPSPIHPTLGVQFPQTGFPFNPTTVETEAPTASFTNQPTVQTHGSLPPVTFVFPQTPQTTQHPSTVDHQPTHPVTHEPEDTEEETAAATSFVPDHSFPTPAPMDINRPTMGHPVHPAEFNPFHALMTTTPSVETTTEAEETTRETETTTETTEEATHEDYEDTSQEMTTGMQSTEITQLSTTTEPETVPTTQSTLPFWMFSTQRVVPQVPQETFGSPSTAGRPPTSEETPTEIHEETTSVVETTAESDVHQQETGSVDHQSSSATSWIVSILAMIVVGLLLLAAVLFILRYMKQSRKLHGKYNPAREEHALSAAYSMPMSHITKEERLI